MKVNTFIDDSVMGFVMVFFCLPVCPASFTVTFTYIPLSRNVFR
jgi:hypothetical protein